MLVSLFAWTDTKEARDPKSQFIVIMNDSEHHPVQIWLLLFKLWRVGNSLERAGSGCSATCRMSFIVFSLASVCPVSRKPYSCLHGRPLHEIESPPRLNPNLSGESLGLDSFTSQRPRPLSQRTQQAYAPSWHKARPYAEETESTPGEDPVIQLAGRSNPRGTAASEAPFEVPPPGIWSDPLSSAIPPASRYYRTNGRP